MRVAICDDEQVQCLLILNELQIWSKEQAVAMEVVPFSNAENFLFHWEDDKNFDLLILDIEMGQMNGMELAKKLRRDGVSIPILFITGYESYMSEGYDVEALHYLLKPVNREKFFAILDRVKISMKPEEKILFQTEDGKLSLLSSQIWFIEAMAHKSVLYTEKEKYVLKSSFSDVMKRLENETGILTVHRSFLVNLGHVASITKNELIMDNGSKIPLSRGKMKEANEAFIQYYR